MAAEITDREIAIKTLIKDDTYTLKYLVAVGVLTALGYLGNTVSLPVAFSVSFVLGSIFVIIAVSLFGPLLGGVSALIASSCTYTLWNHPYAIIIFVCEALWLGFFLKRKYTNVVLIDAAYWLLIGLPLTFIFYFGVMSLGFQSTAMIFLKQSVNGIVNALIAGILITHIPWHKWLRLPADRQAVPYSQIIFQLTSAFLMLPLVAMLLFTNYQESKTIQTMAGELLVSESNVANALMHSWLERHIAAVKTIAKLGKEHHFQPSEKLQTALEQVNSLFPDMYAVFVADNRAKTVAFFPAINARGDSTVGMNFSDREWFKQMKSRSEPFVSDVFLSQATVFVPIFTISVPIVDKGNLSGFGVGTVNLDKMRNVLSQSAHHNNLIITVVDHNNNIVCSTNPGNRSLTPIKQKSGGQTLMIGKDVGLWTPSNKKNISVVDVWKDATYFVTLPIAGTTWTLLTELPVAPLQGYLYHATIVDLIMIFSIFAVAIISSQIVSKLLVRTPVRLATISRDIPGKLEKSAELTWPKSNIAEMHLLIENFKETTHALSLQHQTIKDRNIHLEERVQERTAELRESEEKFRTFVEKANAIVYSITTHGVLTYVSPNWTNMLGHDPGEVIGRSFEFVVHPDDIARCREFLGRLFKTEEKQSGVEYRVRHKNGEWRWHTSSMTPLRDASESVTSFIGIAHDITERKQAEEALRESRQRLAFALEGGELGIWDWYPQTGATVHSDLWAQMLEYRPDEVEPDVDFFKRHIHPDDQTAVLDRLTGHVEGHTPAYESEYRLRTKTGRWLWVLDRGKVVASDKDGHPVRVTGIMADITDRKQAEEKIKASLKEKEVLLKEIHHRVKNNLQIVSSLLFLQASRTEHPGAVSALRESRARVKSMALIHERLYQSPDLTSVDMGGYTKNLVSDLQHSYRTEDGLVRFTLNIEAIPLGIIEAIPCGLIINELVSNALKHAFPEGKEGEITISLRKGNTNRITLTVGDNGIGFPAHVDFRKSPSLGLTLINSLVDQLEGAIELDQSEGTTFTIMFG